MSERKVVVVARIAGQNWARVAFGTLITQTPDAVGTQTVVLGDARQALYYGTESMGEFGLAARGPGPSGGTKSRLTPQVRRAEICGVSLIVDCAEEGARAWLSHA